MFVGSSQNVLCRKVKEKQMQRKLEASQSSNVGETVQEQAMPKWTLGSTSTQRRLFLEIVLCKAMLDSGMVLLEHNNHG